MVTNYKNREHTYEGFKNMLTYLGEYNFNLDNKIVYGSDIDEQGLGTPKDDHKVDSVYGRLKNLQRGTGKIKKWAENVNITVVRQSMSDNMIEKTQLLQKQSYKNDLPIQVDSINLFFSVHYIFNTEKNVHNLLKNIKTFLKANGICLVTTLNGNKVFQKLKNNELVGKTKHGDMLWKIEKTQKYKEKERKIRKLPDNAESLDFPIKFVSNF